ncbi:MAG: hypothetical protein A2776_00225 [Candidatus Levybacteria bacterium RIFCSPHIGHO2_01_FULL_40_10]|nr:MAG: hypothetical protein A2776_00225 [Candidatus Levybacteria bacterium RIFCSPHIGHO2_01_FULL_40_10]
MRRPDGEPRRLRRYLSKDNAVRAGLLTAGVAVVLNMGINAIRGVDPKDEAASRVKEQYRQYTEPPKHGRFS